MVFFASPAMKDGNHGTLEQPFATIGRGITKLGPGDVLNLRHGLFIEPTAGIGDACASRSSPGRCTGRVPGGVLYHQRESACSPAMGPEFLSVRRPADGCVLWIGSGVAPPGVVRRAYCREQANHFHQLSGWIMPTPDEIPNVERPPDWAVDQATDELYDVDDPAAAEDRAWQLVHDAEMREDERHDEYDDPDQGGEA